MRTKTLVPLLLAAALVASCSSLGKNANWTWELVKAPVLAMSGQSAESAAIGSPDVLYDPGFPGGPYVMAFAQGGSDGVGRIALATSPDGVTFTRVAGLNGQGSVLEPGPAGAWDSAFLDTPCLLKVGSTYYLYYFGRDDGTSEGSCLGLATSADGVSFSRVGAAGLDQGRVLQPGQSGAWDSLWVESPSVVYHDGVFYLFYTGLDATWRPRMGLATSADGAAFTRVGGAGGNYGMVLDAGSSGSWDDYAAAVGSALWDGSQFVLVYASQSAVATALGLSTPSLGVAYSATGQDFQRDDQNPQFDQAFIGWQANGPYNPCILYDSASAAYRVWFESGLGIGLAKGTKN